MQPDETYQGCFRADKATIDPACVPEVDTPILYSGAAPTVATRTALKTRWIRDYWKYLKNAESGSVAHFVSTLENEKGWVPTARAFQMWVKDLKPGATLPLPKRPGPKETMVCKTVHEITMSAMASTYPTTGAKKRPRHLGIATEYRNIVEDCIAAGVENIPSERTLQRHYYELSATEQNRISCRSKTGQVFRGCSGLK
ncbi:MAG: hypothetical protein WA771_09060 [Chthoniobacterales bacterium]